MLLQVVLSFLLNSEFVSLASAFLLVFVQVVRLVLFEIFTLYFLKFLPPICRTHVHRFWFSFLALKNDKEVKEKESYNSR